jgi:hypothetical protein
MSFGEWLLDAITEIIPFGDVMLKFIWRALINDMPPELTQPGAGRILADIAKVLLSIPLMIIVRGILWPTYRALTVGRRIRRLLVREIAAPIATALLASLVVGWFIGWIEAVAQGVLQTVLSVFAGAAAGGIVAWALVYLGKMMGASFVLKFAAAIILPGLLRVALSYIFVITVAALACSPASYALLAILAICFIMWIMIRPCFTGMNTSLKQDYLKRKRRLPFIFGLD